MPEGDFISGRTPFILRCHTRAKEVYFSPARQTMAAREQKGEQVLRGIGFVVDKKRKGDGTRNMNAVTWQQKHDRWRKNKL